MKLKLPLKYYRELIEFLSQLTIHSPETNNIILHQFNFAILFELRTLLLQAAMKHLNGSPEKIISKQIPESYGLFFFAHYNGVPIQGYSSVAVKEVCKQVETQLFKSGKYKLTLKS